jgi:hypothetical protein
VAKENSNIAGFLADTWWFGLSQRLTDQSFKDLAVLRAEQGFSAVQLVVGIPPEVGPENENAKSAVGFPWTINGWFNPEYLRLARKKIKFLNELGFVVIVYGAWGHQIEWLGKEKMARWWLQILEALETLNIIYCLCGESNLWVGEASKLLPNKSTDDLVTRQMLAILPAGIRDLLIEASQRLKKQLYKARFKDRRNAWSSVLEIIAQKTNKPIIIHPIAAETSSEAISNPHLLAAVTVQTSHDASARNRLWQSPLTSLKRSCAKQGYINLEPWYEGIRDQFWIEDQMFAYWVSVLAGAVSYCYGTHGVWNVGDGQFLAHWGKQTYAQALALDTPRLLGLSHQQFLQHSASKGESFYQTTRSELITIGKRLGNKSIQFFPDVAKADHVPGGRIWLPLEGVFTRALPASGQVVILCD